MVYAGTVSSCLLLYCYGGTEMSEAVRRYADSAAVKKPYMPLSLQSLELGEAAWNSHWFQWNREVRRRVYLLILRAQRPITVQVPFFAPSLPAFTAASCKRTRLAGCKFMLSPSIFSFCRSSSLRAPLWRWPKQYYKWVCEYLRKWLSLCLCTYPKSMQHFVARKTLKLLNCSQSSLLSAHLSLSVLHNIYRKKSWKIWMWNFIFGLRLDMTSKGNARRGTQSKRIGWLKVPAALALT